MFIAGGLLALAASGCSERSTLPSAISPARASRSAADVDPMWSAVVDGETGPGSFYRLYVPANWNGKLVVYAHGIVAPFAPVAIPVEADFFATIFGEQGFAVALSSYSMNGLDIEDGARRTHQLRGLFASKFGEPSRTYLVGRSMGGFIVTSLAEKYPRQYDGVLPLCGVVGGFTDELAYVFNVRMLFDFLYPNVLPGSVISVPLRPNPADAAADVTAIQNAAAIAVATDTRALPGSAQIALTDQTSMPLPSAGFGGPLSARQFTTFLVTPIVLHATFVDDIMQRIHGHVPVDNASVTYASSAPAMTSAIAAINAGVTRLSADPAAVNWIRNNGETSGDLTIPMLTLHTRYDTRVPIVTESIYHDKVASHGRSDLLVQRTTEGFDHCNFSRAEIAQGLADLVNWVEQGIRPTP